MLWFIVIALGVLVLAIIIGSIAGRASRAARAQGMDRQRDVEGHVRAR
jgi:hypothetical protein